MAKLKINFKTEWLPNDDGLLNTCKCCEETIYANAHELCIVADGIEARWTGVVVCGSCKEVLTDTRHSYGWRGNLGSRIMTKIFEEEFNDGTKLWCHIQNEHYVLGYFGNGTSSKTYANLKTQEDIQDYIQDNGLCPNDFCQSGYIDEGWGDKRACQYCNIV